MKLLGKDCMISVTYRCVDLYSNQSNLDHTFLFGDLTKDIPLKVMYFDGKNIA